MDHAQFYERYARVIATVGLNVQDNQEVAVRAPIEASEFVPAIVAECYKRGASYVHVSYVDQGAMRSRLMHAREETLDITPDADIADRVRIARAGGASLAIKGEDPLGLADIDVARKGRMRKALAAASSELRELAMKDHHPWCLISVPNPIWAKRVFPELPPEEALDSLFDAVARACRLDGGDPVGAWQAHSDRLMRIAGWLTTQAFDSFEYRAPGTELVVGMPTGQKWIGTEGTSANGISFIANMPSDEVFSAPDWRRVEGTVRSTRPLVLGGTAVGNAEFRVEGGRIVEARCEENQAVLEQELDLDEHSRYFGEVALVSEDAPVARSGLTFFDGLYDENSGCHLAFGNAYATCVDGGPQMSLEERRAAGLNTSNQHFDFTVGSDELDIVAREKGGREVPIIENGRWSRQLLAVIEP